MSAAQSRGTGVRRAVVALLCVVAAGALALSFTGLALLGALAGFGALAPVYAVVVDAGTGAATLYWLTGAPGSPRTRYARRLGLALLAVSLVGNAGAHGLAAAGAPVTGLVAGLVLTMPWWAASAVGATPPVIFAAVVHLLAMSDGAPAGDLAGDLAGDDPADAGGPGEGWETDLAAPRDWWASAPLAAPSTPAEYARARARAGDGAGQVPRQGAAGHRPGAAAGDRGGDRQVSAGDRGGDRQVSAGDAAGDRPGAAAGDHQGPADDAAGEPAGDEPDPRRVAELVADGAGRERLARELGISLHAARQILERQPRARTRPPSRRRAARSR